MSEAVETPKAGWRMKVAIFALCASIFTVLWFAVAALGTKWGWWPWQVGLGQMTIGTGPMIAMSVPQNQCIYFSVGNDLLRVGTFNLFVQITRNGDRTKLVDAIDLGGSARDVDFSKFGDWVLGAILSSDSNLVEV